MPRTVARESQLRHLRFWDARQFKEQSGKKTLDAEKVTGFYDLDTQAFAASSPEQVLIAVRGTESVEDWIADFDFSAIAPFVAGPNPYETSHGEPFFVHNGFMASFLFLQRYVHAYLDEHLEKRDDDGNPTGEMKDVMLTGHSLGGATALLLAAYIRSQHAQNVMLYTYGMPRVGERAFAEHYGVQGTEPIVHWRHVHHQDIVTRIPSPWSRYNPLYQSIQGSDIGKHIIDSVRTLDKPYAHHGQMVYLPHVDNEDARPIHGAEDGSPLHGMPEHKIVNINEILLPYLARKVLWTDGTEAENAESDLGTRTALEKRSWDSLTTDVGEEHGDQPDWIQSVSPMTSPTTPRQPGTGPTQSNPAHSNQDEAPTSWLTESSDDLKRALTVASPALAGIKRGEELVRRWKKRGTSHFMNRYTEGMRRSVVDHIERWLTHHPAPRDAGSMGAINQEMDRSRERHTIRQALETVDSELERLREQVHAETHLDADIRLSKGNFYRSDGFPLPKESIIVEITPSREVRAMEVLLDFSPLCGQEKNATVVVPPEVLADAYAEDGETRIVLVCSDPEHTMSPRDLAFLKAQPNAAYHPVPIPGIHSCIDVGPQIQSDDVRVAVSLYGLNTSDERAQQLDTLQQRRQELLSRQHVLISPHLFCPVEMTTDMAETLDETRLDLQTFVNEVKNLRAYEPESAEAPSP